MAPRKPRDIRPDELELWRKVAARAEPLHPEKPVPAPVPAPTPAPAAKPMQPPKPMAEPARVFRLGEKAPASAGKPRPAAQSQTSPTSQPAVRMDPKRYGQMKKGRIAPEARVDLHGLTLSQAHPVLIGFILRAVAEERRLVLVITGKGKARDHHGPIPERHGVLRQQVPHWLHAAPLKPHVLQVSEAHVKHGGAGAFYVYLRRARG